MADKKSKENIRKCKIFFYHNCFNRLNLLIIQIKLVGTLFKKRFSIISTTVVSNRLWLKARKSRFCDVLITFNPHVTYLDVFTLLDKILKADLHVNVYYHQTTHRVALYITASYEKY